MGEATVFLREETMPHWAVQGQANEGDKEMKKRILKKMAKPTHCRRHRKNEIKRLRRKAARLRELLNIR